MTDEALARFLAKTQILPGHGGCWRWIGAINAKGYGNFLLDATRKNRVYAAAHRVAYEHWRGEITEPQLDHLCRHRWCVNPWHLEPVTNRENAQRGQRGRLVTECVNGHAYDEENTGWHSRPTGDRRYCKRCARERMAAKRATGYIAPSRRVAEHGPLLRPPVGAA